MERGVDLSKLGLHGSFLGAKSVRRFLLRGGDKGRNPGWSPFLLQARKMAYSLIVLLNFNKMLHEVLFALLGFTGSIFQQVTDDRTFSNGECRELCHSI